MDLSLRSRKRGRDEADDLGIQLEGVPADKRQRNISNLQFPAWLQANNHVRPSINRAHTLPFRLDSVTLPAPFEPNDLIESPTDSSSGNSPASFASLPAPVDTEMNIDNQVSIVGSASPPSPFVHSHHFSHLLPDKLNSPGLDASGRIPTPINASFNLAPPPAPTRSRTDSALTSLPRFAAPTHQRLENNYRMPSPIVESPLIEDSMDMGDFPSSQLSRLSVSQQDSMMDVDDRIWSSQHHSQQYMSSSSPPPSDHNALSFDVVPATPGRMGRARSGAFSASSTPQDKGGRRVVFGYREDCDKCRMRFPGHFAHFV